MVIDNACSRSAPPDLYRQLLDMSSDPIFCIAPDFRYLYANQAFADGIGRNLEDIVGRTLWDVFAKDEADKRATLVKWVFDHGKSKVHEIMVQGRHGDRHYLTTVTPMFGDQGQVRSVLANSKDITERKQAESVLQASEEKYRALVETTSTGYLILDREGKVIDANPEYVRLTGYSDLQELLGRSVLAWTADYEIERNGKAVAQCARDGFIRNLVIDYVDRTGRITPVEINATVIGDGDSVQILSLCRDITDRKRMEMELQSREERLQLALSSGELGFWDWNIPSGEVLYSEHWFSMLGLPMDEAKLDLDSWIKLIHPDDLANVNGALESHLKGRTPTYECEHRVRHQNGRWLWLLDRGRVVEWDKAGAPVRAVGTYFDITERKKMEHHIRELAFHDSLTQLPNRRLLRDRLAQAMATNKRSGLYGALMFLDLDNFKPLNDARGHDFGDLLLIEVANRLKACVREMDTVARVGGDEFVVMLSELVVDRDDSTVQARNLAEKIRTALSEPYLLSIRRHGMADTTVTHHCTASIGVALFIDHEASPDDVLKWADAGMYQAKQSGRNSVRFYDPRT